MVKYYSRSTGGFYDNSVHRAGQIPTDAVKIDDEEYQALFAAQSQGKQISPDDRGYPVAVDREITADQQQKILVSQAKAALLASDATFIRTAAEGKAWPAAWETYRQELREVVAGSQEDLPERPDYP